MAASCIYVYIRVCSIVVLYVNHVVYHMAYGQAYISLIAYDCNNEIKSLCLTSIIQCLEVVAHCLGLIAQETFFYSNLILLCRMQFKFLFGLVAC